MLEVREKRGLTYGVDTQLQHYDHANIMVVGAATSNENAGQAVDLIKAEWQRMADGGATADEVKDAQTYLTGALPLALTSTDKIADFTLQLQLEHLGMDYPRQRLEKLNAVTVEDVARMAKRLLNTGALTLIAVGEPVGVKAQNLPDPTQTPSWQALSECKPVFDETPREYHAAGLTLDLTTSGFDGETQQKLLTLAKERNWFAARDFLMEGGVVNVTENRAALHTALRARSEDVHWSIREEVKTELITLRKCVNLVQTLGAIDIIHIGMGGSGLAPMFLRSFFQGFIGQKYRLHILVNADPSTLQKIKQQCDPRKTVIVVASKTFTTDETMLLATHLRPWLGDLNRMFAITGQPEGAKAFGVPADNIMGYPDWLGGRFSLWGSVAFPVLLAFGNAPFEELLHGARTMDEHFSTAPAEKSLPVLFALAHIWQRNFMGCASHAVIPYADALRHFPVYIQQLEMESNGKAATVATASVNYGGVGTTVQHSFMQWLHQGNGMSYTDFIVVDKLPGNEELTAFLRNSALAQSSALAHGAPPDFPGGRPSNMIFMNELSSFTLGALLALYEHKVYLEAHIWGINCFDQPGVELGKRLTRQIGEGQTPRSTASRLARYK